MPNRRLATGAAVACALLAGCGLQSASTPQATLNVFAAASLTETFETLEATFEYDHPGVDVKLNLAGSQDLVTQIAEGADADVLATASSSTMAAASDKKLVGESVPFATNTLTLITAPGNPHNVTGLDSSLDGLKLVVCAVEVPCGALTQKLVSTLGAVISPVSEEQAVTDVRGKVASGQADAGIVYRTDALAEGQKVDTVAIAGADREVTTYPIAVTEAATNKEAAQEWIDLVLSEKGQKVLADAGFSAAK